MTISLSLPIFDDLNKIEVKRFVESLSWNLSDVLMVRRVLWVLGRKTTEVKCYSFHILSGLHAASVSLLILIPLPSSEKPTLTKLE